MATEHTWNFFRAGGFDQVQLDSGADLLALKDLDQKLWVALSCPTRGIEFDTRTLDLIDSDADGRVRANEVLEAIAWAGGLLKNADLLVSGTDELALADINGDAEEGAQILRSARHILKNLGKPEAAQISMADMADIEKFVAGLQFNGDGVVCAAQVNDAALRATLEDIVKCAGSVADLSGDAGVNQEIADRFVAEAIRYSDWYAQGETDAAILVLGEQTGAAADAFHAVKDKVSDYFTRCQLAAYDARAAVPLSRSVEDYQQLAGQSLSAQSVDIAIFPLAGIAANKPLSLITNINPAWQASMDALRLQLVTPLLGNKESLTAAEWTDLCDKFAAFDAWQAGKPQSCAEPLGIVRVIELLAGGHKPLLDELIAQDKAVEIEVKAIHAVERLLRYKRDLYVLVNNFVSFRNFYTGKKKGIFQVGTLYLDGRSCELTVKVDDVVKHAAYANMSGVCLAYCDCVRNGGTMSIAAAFTAGDSDYLMPGRNGVFYDRKGQDWDATIVRIIDQPISIRQAFWSPYKKLSRAIGEQLQKLAASKASAAEGNLTAAAIEHGKSVANAAPATPKPAFDVGKFAGIFAAMGLAIGAIGGILASIVAGLLGLKLWQMPLAIIGLLLLISGPAMVLAGFKLKRRNLAPILDANGWAVNARARINIPFGTSLTGLAGLPDGAHRSLVDPFADKKPVWPYYLLLLVIVGALLGMYFMGYFGA
ncbi:MAG: hypothetical protein COS43_01780 [Gallionellales bacterium CG03_land_8_20_14_0_80_55_15]|nr:MAG: hypothetical protein COS43_01780 [Gallionellales bacterium CG03_land_8_20_14_0_80_55_15]